MPIRKWVLLPKGIHNTPALSTGQWISTQKPSRWEPRTEREATPALTRKAGSRWFSGALKGATFLRDSVKMTALKENGAGTGIGQTGLASCGGRCLTSSGSRCGTHRWWAEGLMLPYQVTLLTSYSLEGGSQSGAMCSQLRNMLGCTPAHSKQGLWWWWPGIAQILNSIILPFDHHF